MSNEYSFRKQTEAIRGKLSNIKTPSRGLSPEFDYRRALTLSPDPARRFEQKLFKVEAVQQALDALALDKKTVILEGGQGTGKTTALCELAYVLEKEEIPFTYVSCKGIIDKLKYAEDKIGYLSQLHRSFRNLSENKKVFLIESMEDLFTTWNVGKEEQNLLDEIRKTIFESNSLIVANRYTGHVSDRETYWTKWNEDLSSRASETISLTSKLKPEVAEDVVLHSLIVEHRSNSPESPYFGRNIDSFIESDTKSKNGISFFKDILPLITHSGEARLHNLKKIDVIEAKDILESLKNNSKPKETWQREVDSWLSKLNKRY